MSHQTVSWRVVAQMEEGSVCVVSGEDLMSFDDACNFFDDYEPPEEFRNVWIEDTLTDCRQEY